MKMIVIGSSWGGLEPTKIILDELPVDLDAAVLVVRHSTPGGQSLLQPVLQQHSDLPVLEVHDGCPILAGHVYVTPPGVSVTMKDVKDRGLCFVVEPVAEVSCKGRPSIDDALTSAASHFGDDCIGIVLSGYLDDGTKGAIRVDRVNGTMIVQSPADAHQPSMPLAVIKGDSPDFIVPGVHIGSIIKHLVAHESSMVSSGS